MKITWASLILIPVFLTACSSSVISSTFPSATQLHTPTNVISTRTPIPASHTPTIAPSVTVELTPEPLPPLQLITPGNAEQVGLLRTLTIPGFKPSSVSQCSLSFSPGGELLAGVCDYSTAPVWEVSSGKLKYTLLDEAAHEVAIAFSPVDDVLAVAGFSGEIQIFDANSGVALEKLTTLPSQVWNIASNPTGKQLAASTFSSGAFLTGFPDGGLIWNNGERGRICVLSVAFSPDGNRLALGRATGGVMVLDVETGSVVVELPVPAPVGDLSYSPDGRWLATGSDDHKIRMWDTADHSLEKILTGHTGFVNGVAFSPEGSLLVSGSHDHKVGLWDIQTGRPLKFL
ncbi:MAG: hypothetical protein WAV05_10625 [Anaerolineales bacterium]